MTFQERKHPQEEKELARGHRVSANVEPEFGLKLPAQFPSHYAVLPLNIKS